MASQPEKGPELTFEQKRLNRLSFFDGKGELLKLEDAEIDEAEDFGSASDFKPAESTSASESSDVNPENLPKKEKKAKKEKKERKEKKSKKSKKTKSSTDTDTDTSCSSFDSTPNVRRRSTDAPSSTDNTPQVERRVKAEVAETDESDSGTQSIPPRKPQPVVPPLGSRSEEIPRKNSKVRPIPSTSMVMQTPIMDRSNMSIAEISQEILCRNWLTKLLLMKNQILSIPDEISGLPLLKVLDLSYNYIRRIPDGISSLSVLEELNLSGNKVAAFPKSFPSSMVKLDLTANGLLEIPSELTSAFNLKILELSRNKLKELPYSFKNMTNLTFLNLRDNRLVSLRPEICKCKALETLFVSGNKLNVLPSQFQELSNLTSLDLCKNKLSRLPNSMSSNLVKLNLSYNLLESINDNFFEHMSNMSDVNLKFNLLKSIPSSLFTCYNLSTLDLTHNLISTIPASLANWSNLTELNLCYNMIENIPNEIGQLSYLTMLNLSVNKIKELPNEITYIAGLKRCYVGYNMLKSLPLHANPEFLEWESLEELYLNGNPIEELPEGLGNLWTLQELNCCNLSLSSIPPFISQLTSLVRLDFSGNNLTHIPKEFTSLTDLQKLYIAHNQLVSIDEDVTDELFLDELDITSNLITELPRRVHVWAEGGSLVAIDRNPCKLEFKENDHVKESKNYGIQWAEITGRRPTQEDAFLLKGNFMENSDLFGIFDGHASSAASKYAAEHFPAILAQKLGECEPLEAIQTTFSQVHEKFREFIKTCADPTAKNAGTTALVTYIKDNKIYVGNLGDTRGVLCRKGKAMRISVDHKPNDEEMRVNALGGYITNDSTRRINGLLAVARGIGDFFMEPFVTCNPYLAEIEMCEDDEFLILACDGVWDEIEDQKAVDIVAMEKDRYKGACRLRDYAYLLNSEDNISVIVVDLKNV